MWIVNVFLVVPSTNTQWVFFDFNRFIAVTQINESLFGFILMLSKIEFAVSLIIEYDLFYLVGLELIIELFDKTDLFTHFFVNKNYRISNKIYWFICEYFLLTMLLDWSNTKLEIKLKLTMFRLFKWIRFNRNL